MEIWRWLTFLVPRVRTWPFLPVFSEPITQAERGKEDKAFCLAWQCTINTSMGDHGVCVCVCSCSCVWWIHQFKAGKPSQMSLQWRHFQHLSRTFRKSDTRSRQWYTRKSANTSPSCQKVQRRHLWEWSSRFCVSKPERATASLLLVPSSAQQIRAHLEKILKPTEQDGKTIGVVKAETSSSKHF